ncbi:MAG: selenocysteine-specific translation elongation factor [Sphingomonas sp.]
MTKRLLVGVIGHVDHGKTALVRALTGMETDRLEEEKRRGISIALGFAHVRAGDAEIDFIDMPGHERFVRTMVAGASGIDAVLLVVAANEGVKPQTIEHLDIAGLLGIRHAVAVVTKSDLVTPEAAAARATEVAALVARAGLVAPPPLLASAVTGDGLEAVMAALAALEAERRADEGFPYLPVDRAFSIAGHGTVVTGTLRRGALAASDTLVALPGALDLRIRALQVHGAAVTMASPGQRVAVNLRGVEPGQVPGGTVLTRAGQLQPSSWLTIELQAVSDAPPLASGARLRLLHGTAETGVRLRLLDRDTLQPGERAFAQLRCEEPVHVPARAGFVLRIESPPATVAGGRVLDPVSQRARRNNRSVLDRLAVLAATEGADLAAAEIARAGGQGVTMAELATLAGTTPERVAGWHDDAAAVLIGGRRFVARAAFDRLVAQLPGFLAKQVPADTPGLSVEQIAGRVRGYHAEVIAQAVARLVAAGSLRQEGGHVRTPQLVQERRAAEREEALVRQIAATYRAAGLTPPDLAGVSKDPAARRVANRLVRDGVLVRTTDRVQKREILFHAEAMAQARRRLAAAMGNGEALLVREAGALLGLSRKYSVPLLEYLDSVQFTRRVGDRRVLGSAALG